MPASVITTAGARFFLGRCVFGEWSPLDNFQLALFTNDVTPSAESALGDFDRSGMNPSQFDLFQENWYPPVSVAGVWRTYWGTDATTFTVIPSTITVYGYLVWEPAFDTLLWAQRFDSPVPLIAGQQLGLRPYFEFRACP